MSDRTKVYPFWGVDISIEEDDEFISTCPFCQHDDTRSGRGHFYISKTTAAFCCKTGHCGKEGSWREFLKEIYEHRLAQTTEKDLLRFVKLQGIPLPILKEKKLAYDSSFDKYFLPAYNVDDVTDLRIYRKDKKEHSTEGAFVGLTNLPELLSDTNHFPVYICEGFRDQLALQWLLWRTKNEGIVIGSPGCNTWKEEWSKAFADRNVFIIYDNDEAGYGHFEANKVFGSLKVAARLKNHARSISFITWPDTYKKGYDVRDFVNEPENKQNPENAYRTFTSYLSHQHKTEKLVILEESKNNVKLAEIINAASELYKLDSNFIDAVKLALATVFSVRLQGNDNVWTMLVGAPGTGKSIICEIFETAIRHVIWESTLTKKGLVSGWGLGQNTIDTSILNRVHNKALVVKDLTQLLRSNQIERDAVFGILTNAFDGRHKEPFGTGERVYICSFSMLVGTTFMVYTYDTTQFGERFLKFIMKSKISEAENIQEKALDTQIFGAQSKLDLQTLVSKFLCNTYDLSSLGLRGRVPAWFRGRIKPLGRLIATLRTPVVRFEQGLRVGELRLQPVLESGNRPTIQLEKLAIMLSIIEEKPMIDESIYELIKQVALDTVFSFSTLIVKTLIHERDYLQIQDIREKTKIRRPDYYLDDLETLKIIEKNCSKPTRYIVSEGIKELWQRAGL